MTDASRKFRLGPTSYSPSDLADWPGGWALAGVALGLALGVTTLSIWLVTLGLVAHLVNMNRHAAGRREGWLFATGPSLMMAWVLGYVVRGIAF